MTTREMSTIINILMRQVMRCHFEIAGESMEEHQRINQRNKAKLGQKRRQAVN